MAKTRQSRQGRQGVDAMSKRTQPRPEEQAQAQVQQVDQVPVKELARRVLEVNK